MSLIFEIASKRKLRFPFKDSMLLVEDLWDSSFEDLASIFKILKSQIKWSPNGSLPRSKTVEDFDLNLKISIIRHIATIRVEEYEEKQNSKEMKDKNYGINS